jgi:signal transduction histidine kinase/CheY-like chemotaxis protein
MARSGKSISDLIRALFFYAVISGIGVCICISAIIMAFDTKLSTNSRIVQVNETLNRSFPMLIDAYRFNETDALSFIMERMGQVKGAKSVRIEESFANSCPVEINSIGEWDVCWGVPDVTVSRSIAQKAHLVYQMEPVYLSGPLYRVGFILLGVLVLFIYLLLFVAFRSIWDQILGPIRSFHQSMANQTEFPPDAKSDLREIQSLKVALSNARRAAQNEAVVRTISMVFHDVVKPFAVLKGSLTALGQAKSFSEFQTEYPRVVSQVARATRKAEVLMQEISDYSSALKLELRPCSVESIVRESLGEASDFFNGQSFAVETLYRHQHKILCDEFRLQRVFSNIIVNACQATRFKGRLWIHTHEENSRVYIVIGNSGSHVPESSLAKLFQYRFTEGKTRGTGLGLAIAKHIVEAHGGSIRVINSAEKDQVEFEFDVSVSQEDDVVRPDWIGDLSQFGSQAKAPTLLGKKESPLVEISGNVNGEAPISPPAIRVLVIDDDAGDREQVRRSFAAHGGVGLFEIVECSEPGALHDDLIRSAQIFVVDLDLGTADVDGFDVLERIRQARGESARIFVCSNRTDSESVSRVLKSGATAFLAKPFSFARFIKHGLGV